MAGRDLSIKEAVQAYRWLLDALLRPFPNGTINVFDSELRYLYGAGAPFDRAGRSPDLFIGRRLDELFPAELVDQARPFYARAFAGETVTFALTALGHEYSIHAWPLTEADGTINAIMAVAHEAPPRPSAEVLPARLREVSALVAAGLTNQQIAGRLQLTTEDVSARIDLIMRRLGFTTRTQIGVWAVAVDLYRPDEDDGGTQPTR